MRHTLFALVSLLIALTACAPTIPQAFLPVPTGTPALLLAPTASATPTLLLASTASTTLTATQVAPTATVGVPLDDIPPILLTATADALSPTATPRSPDPTATTTLTPLIGITPSIPLGAPPATITPYVPPPSAPLATAYEIYSAGVAPTNDWGAFWQFTEEEYATLESTPAGTLTFYNLATGEVCDGSELADYHTFNPVFAWNRDGSYFIVINFTLYQGRPCQGQEGLEIVTALDRPWPGSLTALRGAESDTYRLLVALDGESRTWHLYDPATQTVTDLDYTVALSREGVSLSPDGRHLAIQTITSDVPFGATTYLVEVATGAIVAQTSYEISEALGGVVAPSWLTNDKVLVNAATHTQGPLIVGLDGSVEEIANTLFADYVDLNLCGPSCDHVMFATSTRLPASDSHIITLHNIAGGGAPYPIYIYESATQNVTETDALRLRESVYSPDGRYAVYAGYESNTDPNPTQFWLRKLNSRVADRVLLYTVPADGPGDITWSPDSMRVAIKEAVGGWHVVRVEDGRPTMQAYFDGISQAERLEWSPDGRYVVLYNRSEAGKGVYVVLVE